MASHSVRDSIFMAGMMGPKRPEDDAEDTLDDLRRRPKSTVIEASRRASRVDIRGKHLSGVNVVEALKELDTNVSRGLTRAEAAARLAKNGPNELHEESPPGILLLFAQQFLNVIILLLVAACIASFALGETVEGVAVIIIVLLNASISVATEHGANRALAALKGLAKPNARVVRGGDEINVPTSELVIGDIVLLETGDVVPADCRVISAVDVTVDESLLTGEARPVPKSSMPPPPDHEALTPRNEAFMSCTVLSGVTRVVVFATGMATRVGRIAESLNSASRSESSAKPAAAGGKPAAAGGKPAAAAASHGGGCCRDNTCCRRLCDTGKRTPMQEQLHHLGLAISAAALTACVLVFIIGVLRDYRDPEHPNNPPAVQMILVAVSLAVSAIPEGLPLCVTIALALGTHAMAKKQALVRRLPSVETLGATTVICSDKTGTLTMNRQTATRAFVPGTGEVAITGKSDAPLGFFVRGGAAAAAKAEAAGDKMPDGAKDPTVSPVLLALLGSVAVNSTARMLVARHAKGAAPAPKKDGDEEESAFVHVGNKRHKEVHELAKAGFAFSGEGNASETPLLLAAAKAGVLPGVLRDAMPCLRAVLKGEAGPDSHSPDVPFSSKRKMMATVTAVRPVADAMADAMDDASPVEPGHVHAAGVAADGSPLRGGSSTIIDNTDRARSALSAIAGGRTTSLLGHIKGAPDVVVPHCTHVALPDGAGGVKVVRLEASMRASVTASLHHFSAQALRCIAVAVRALPGPDPFPSSESSVDEKLNIVLGETPASRAASAAAAAGGEDTEEPGLVLLGLVASIDPHRPEVPPAVSAARGAGIRTVMITGDHRDTAVAIARAIGILSPGDDSDEASTDCRELRAGADAVDESVYISNADLDEMTSRVNVFARAQPLDKLMIVRSLQRQKQCVAMTGDGVNDAPALSRADIGIAMGIAGTEVAKGASDLVLLDDSFATIARAVKLGRSLYGNILSFLQYLLGTNVSQVTAILVCVAAGLPIPLKALSILVINILVDTMPAISLSVEPASEDVMDRPPRPRSQPILHGRMWTTIFGHSLTLAAGAVACFIIGLTLQAGGAILATDLQALVAQPAGTSTCSYLTTDGTWGTRDGADCGLKGFKEARTMVFVTVVFAELVRGFTVRSHTKPFWVGWSSNRALLAAVAASMAIALVMLFVPGLNDEIMGFQYLGWPQWLIALGLGPVLTVTVDELIKARYAVVVEADRRWSNLTTTLHEVQTELRRVRHHVQRVEGATVKDADEDGEEAH